MEDLKHKIEILVKIGRVLNEKNVTWGVGASLLLYLKGIAPSFHDIDLLVAETDVEKLKETLGRLGKPEAPRPDPRYKTKFFLEYDIEGVEIDVIAHFVIVSEGKDYDFPFTENDIKEHLIVSAVSIPLMSVLAWRRYYDLMGRTEKVAMIDSAQAKKPNGNIL